jgi:hypothetical protein
MQHATADWFTIKEAIKISKKNRLYKNKKVTSIGMLYREDLPFHIFSVTNHIEKN